MTENVELIGDGDLTQMGANFSLERRHFNSLVAQLAEGSDVLEITSGGELGADTWNKVARSVLSVILSEVTGELVGVFSKQGSVRPDENITIASGSADVVVFFDTGDQASGKTDLVKEVRRVLKGDGIFVLAHQIEDNVATLDTRKTSALTRDGAPEPILKELLGQYFPHVSTFAQKTVLGSIIASNTEATKFYEVDSENNRRSLGISKPGFIIGLASSMPLEHLEITGSLSSDIRDDKHVQEYLELEKAQWSDTLMQDIDHISGQVDALQRSNWMSSASLWKLLKRLVYTRMLYSLANLSVLSERRRQRFMKSAAKRDPMLLSRKVDQFCIDYYNRITTNKAISSSRSEVRERIGITVTAIIPNFNHARFLAKRLDSILEQTYPLIDVVVLDDCSTDDSRSVIDAYISRYPDRIRAIYNSTNSGSVFRQWQKGHSEAKGDLIWICESDDFCEPTFVERTVTAFRNPSVMLAFGRTQFVNADGDYFSGLDQYREESEPGIWEQRIVRPAAEWFRGGFGVKNVIANVGGSLWRRFDIPDLVWDDARKFKVMGDWYLYSVVAGGGQIAYEPSAISYFRIHGANTSGGSAQSSPGYYREYSELMTSLKKRWDIPDNTLRRFIEVSRSISKGAGIQREVFDNLLDFSALASIHPEKIHVLIGILGFSFGGGEIFPIHLANALHRKGVMVSVLQMHDADDHRDVRRMLNPGIPVYTANSVRDKGVGAFLRGAGVSIVHSHVANVDGFLLDRTDVQVPYIATLHGSYEAMGISTSRIARWSKRIHRFAYTADRNLAPFSKLNVSAQKFRKVKNAMPVDFIEYPSTRQQLGIPADAVVFTFVARGAEGKGWSESVKAYLQLRRLNPDVPMALLMVGEGPAVTAAKKLAIGDSSIHFLGFVKEIYGLYRMSDVALVPTRFPGESYPLCLIQALQVGVPCVATDVGEIRGMCQVDGQNAGIIIPYESNDEVFTGNLADAMKRILDETLRNELRGSAEAIGKSYDIDVLASAYLEEYLSILSEVCSVQKK